MRDDSFEPFMVLFALAVLIVGFWIAQLADAINADFWATVEATVKTVVLAGALVALVHFLNPTYMSPFLLAGFSILMFIWFPVLDNICLRAAAEGTLVGFSDFTNEDPFGKPEYQCWYTSRWIELPLKLCPLAGAIYLWFKNRDRRYF